MKKILFCLLIFLSLTSCKYMRNTEMLLLEKDVQFSKFAEPSSEYIIVPFDLLSIQITTNDGFNYIGVGGGGNSNQSSRGNQQGGMQYEVEFDGLIKLPILGRIKITGLTPRKAEEFLEKEYSKYYNKPFVQVKVTNRKIYIFQNRGAIASVVSMSSNNFTLIDAIAQTGGISDDSKSYSIKLIRGKLNEEPLVYKYSVLKLSDLKNANLLLEANDIIYIDSKPRYIKKFLNELSPYLSLLTTVLLIIGYVNMAK